MAGGNPVFGRIEKQLREERQYAGFGQQGYQQQQYPQQGYPHQDYPQGYPQQGYPQQGQPPVYDPAYAAYQQQQLEQSYQRPSAGPLETGRVTVDDVVMKTLALFGILVVAAAGSWFTAAQAPRLGLTLWLGGMIGGLVIGLVIAFMKKVNVPLIIGYAIFEGVFVGAFSEYINSIRQYHGIVATAVIATLCTFAGMFIGYKTGVIKVTSTSRRIFGMMLIGYVLFSLVNLVGLLVGWTSGWGFGGSSMLGIGISLLGVGLASYSLAVDFDSIDQAVRMGAPEKYSWLLAHGLIVSLVWLYIEIVRLLARLRD